MWSLIQLAKVLFTVAIVTNAAGLKSDTRAQDSFGSNSQSAAAEWQYGLDVDHAATGIYERGEGAFLVGRISKQSASPHEFNIYDYLDRHIQKLDNPTKIGNGLFQYKLPTDRLGYFEIRPISAEAAAVVPARGSRPAGRITYSVVNSAPKDLSNNFQSPFSGIQGTAFVSNKVGQGWDLYPLLGISYVGISNYTWKEQQPEKPDNAEPVKNISPDRFLAIIRRHKIVPIFLIDLQPLWAVTPNSKSRPNSSFGLPPNKIEKYEEFLGKIVPIIRDRYNFLPHRIYQIFWEPNDDWGWFGDDAELLEVARAAHKVIHNLDPSAKVAGPTLAELNAGSIAQFSRLMSKGLGKYIDVVSWHPYVKYPPEAANPELSITELEKVSMENAGKRFPFIGTEAGYDSSKLPDPNTKWQDQAYANTALALIMKGEGACAHFYFYLIDYPEGDYGIMFNLSRDLKYGSPTVAPKPSFAMIRQANDVMNGSRATGKFVNLGGSSELRGYVYADPKLKISTAALWDPSGKSRKIKFQTGRPTVEVMDEFGNGTVEATQEGHIDLELKRAPTYIRGIDANAHGGFVPKTEVQCQ